MGNGSAGARESGGMGERGNGVRDRSLRGGGEQDYPERTGCYTAGQAGVGGNQRQVEAFGEGEVGGIVGGNVVSGGDLQRAGSEVGRRGGRERKGDEAG